MQCSILKIVYDLESKYRQKPCAMQKTFLCKSKKSETIKKFRFQHSMVAISISSVGTFCTVLRIKLFLSFHWIWQFVSIVTECVLFFEWKPLRTIWDLLSFMLHRTKKNNSQTICIFSNGLIEFVLFGQKGFQRKTFYQVFPQRI